MNIIKNWFYKLSEIYDEKITIEENLIVSIFDDTSFPPLLSKRGARGELWISLWKNTILEFYSFIENTDDLKINFIQKQEWSKLKVNCLLFSSNIVSPARGRCLKGRWGLKAKIYSKIISSNTKSDIKILSLVWNDWFIDLDWIIEIWENINWVDWNLSEENLFLWNTWKIKWIPTLLVRSDDVKASHSCKMERISDEKLFYLRSRWIWRQNALVMMIEAKIKSLFSCLFMFDNTFYKELVEKILKKVQ